MKIANSKSHIVKFKNLHYAFYILPFAFLLLSGCASLRAWSEIQAGRTALHTRNYKQAVVHFQRMAEMDPNFVFDYSIYRLSVWTYLGRAHYNAGNLAQARQALEKARSRHEWDDTARLYLGLTLARDGNRDRGVREIEAGLQGLGNWLGSIHRYIYEGHMWDPGGEIRREIDNSLAMIRGRDVNVNTLSASVEWIGRALEEEIEEVRRDKRDEHRDDDDDDSGPSGS